MSINKKWLSGIDQVKRDYIKMGHHEFKRIYSKHEVFMGMTNEIDQFLKTVMTENKEWKNEET
jgi:hypothetical protein